MSVGRWAMVVAVMSVGSLPAFPAQADTVPKGVQALNDCRAVAEALSRLACYDQAMAALEASIKTKDVVVIDRAELRQNKRRGFGLPFTERTVLGAAAEPEAKEQSARINGIALVGQFLQFTLDNGAVWRATEASFNEPKLGSSVTIKRGALGSFRLVFPNVPAVTAKRIR